MAGSKFSRVRVLINEDAPTDAELVEREVRKVVDEPQIRRVQTKEAFMEALSGFNPELIISDYALPSFDGLTALKIVRSLNPEQPFILVSGSLGEELAIDTMKQGATDYVLKDRLKRLAPAIERALKEAEDRKARTRALEALRRSEERQAHILQSLPMALYTAKANGGYECTWIGGQAERLSGFPPDRFVQDAAFWFQHIHPEDLDRVTGGVRALYRTGTHTMEYRWKCADGSYRWFLDRTVLLKDERGNPLEILGTWIDVHDRKTMEGRLEEREQLLNSVFEEAPIGIALVSVDGEIMLVNRRYEIQLGYERGSLLGRSILDITDPADRPQSADRLARVKAGDRSVSAREKRYLRQDGTVMWAELTSSVLTDPDGRPRFVLTMLLDISERRKFQDVLVRQERLRALGQMASAIAHDINNALSPVLGYAELIETQEEALSERSRRYLQTIKTSAGDIGRIAGRMREFYQAREEEVVLAPLEANALMTEAVEMTAPRWRTDARQRGIKLDLDQDLAADLPPLAGVATDIRECLVNLIFNAVDAMPSGGRILMRSSLVEGSVVLAVTDNGQGMDAATRRRCLEPFFTTKGAAGTGLGLASVAGVMRRHGGRVEIESEPGKGTTMRLFFPCTNAAAEAAEPAVVPGSAASALRILCIDDETAILTLMGDLLTPDGHRVETATGGHAGLAVFQESLRSGRPFDVVITDHGMGGMDGHQVAAAVKGFSAGTPVILMTGWAAGAGEDASPPPNVDHVLRKPPRRAEVRRLLAMVVPPRRT